MCRVRPIALAAALAASACGLLTGPYKSIAGDWRAPGIGHSGHYFDLSLTQSGDEVSGVACSSESGFLLFEGARVSGELPTVTFVVPSTGARFAGKFEEDRDQIAGDLGFGSGHIPLRFVRSEDGGKCAGAKPLSARP
jgi:hypothetical protein